MRREAESLGPREAATGRTFYIILWRYNRPCQRVSLIVCTFLTSNFHKEFARFPTAVVQ
jgi:hypothetical protein